MFEAYPVELRPVLTRHRLRRRRHRSAASVLAGAALALGISALRPAQASATTVSHAAASYDPHHGPDNDVDRTPPTALNNPQRPAPRHAAPQRPATETPRASAASALNSPPASNASRRAPSQPGRHARPSGPSAGSPLVHLSNGTTTEYSGLPPPYPWPRPELIFMAPARNRSSVAVVRRAFREEALEIRVRPTRRGIGPGALAPAVVGVVPRLLIPRGRDQGALVATPVLVVLVILIAHSASDGSQLVCPSGKV
jgi:hypothetical protein